MVTHSSVLAWEFHGQRSLAGCSPWGHRVGHDQATHVILVEIKGNECKATSTVQVWWLVRNRGRALALLVWISVA